MQYCCDPKVCPCGPDRCGNPPLSKREGVPVAKDGLVVIWVSEPFLPFTLAWRELSSLMKPYCLGKQTGNRGFGLKTMRPIKRGEFVLEYRGEVRRAPALTPALCHPQALTLHRPRSSLGTRVTAAS